MSRGEGENLGFPYWKIKTPLGNNIPEGVLISGSPMGIWLLRPQSGLRSLTSLAAAQSAFPRFARRSLASNPLMDLIIRGKTDAIW